MYLEENDFNIISDKIIFPSLYYSYYAREYIGAIIIRCEYVDVITYLYKESDKIILKPVRRFKKNEYDLYETCRELHNRSIKVFLTKEEFEADNKKKKEKNDARRKKDREITKDLTRQAQYFLSQHRSLKYLKLLKRQRTYPM